MVDYVFGASSGESDVTVRNMDYNSHLIWVSFMFIAKPLKALQYFKVKRNGDQRAMV
jgi:hypothetical protein